MLVGSALCSGTEAALLSVSPIKAQQLALSGGRPAKALLAIRNQINRPIASIVVLNNIFNIVGSIVIGRLATTVFGNALLGVFSALLTLLIILIGEIIPKTLGERYAVDIGLAVAIPVRSLTWLMTPVVILLERITAPLVTNRIFLPTTNEAEITLLVKIGYQEGIIEDDEADMIQRVFRLNDVTAADIMTPRVALTHLPGQQPLNQVQTEIIQSQHSRILVSGSDIDHIDGVVLKTDLLAALVNGCGHQPVVNFARPVRFVPLNERADRLLKTFQTAREHLGVVVDEYGGISGGITLEDVLEVLIGEIVDETDKSEDLQALARQRRKRLLQTKGFSA